MTSFFLAFDTFLRFYFFGGGGIHLLDSPHPTRKFYNIKQGSKHSHEPDRCADGSGDGDFFDDASTFVERHRRRRRVGRRLGDDLELGNPAERVESLAPKAERLQLVGRQVLEGRDLGGAVRGAQQPEIRIG